MAKLNLSVEGDKIYGAFARGYRQSAYVEDRRAEQFRPTRTPTDFEYNQIDRRRNVPQVTSGGSSGADPSESTSTPGAPLKPRQARKAEPEEAIRATSTPRGN